MALPSTYQLQHSLPNRSPSNRPRSLSLSEYQPINFDREALESAYQASLNLPSSSASYRSNLSSVSLSAGGGGGGGTSVEAHDATSARSSLSHTLRSGDNPHLRDHEPVKPPTGNFAGVGAGHSLTPPSSPFHAEAQQVHNQALMPPTPPARPADLPSSTFVPESSSAQAQSQTPHPPTLPPRVQPPPLTMRRSQSDTNVNRDQPWQGQREWIEGDGHGRGKRRALPAVPANLPVPEPPAWEPDYKPQIPPNLTAASAAYAYSSLSAPPPNLPPRRGQGSRPAQVPPPPPIEANPYASSSDASAGPSGTAHGGSSSGGHSTETQSTQPPAGAPDFPPATDESGRSGAQQAKPPRNAEKEVFLRSTDKTPIWSTHYIDPSLRESLVNIPHHVTNMANVALSGLSSGPKTKYNSTIGAPVDGLARAARDWAVSPDGRFVSEHGGMELGLGVINSGGTGWGKDKGRKKARVEVVSKTGGIKLDVIEIDDDRQLDLRIDTKSGDVLVLLPETFHGPIHITSYNRPPEFLPILSPQLAQLANPYSSLYSTFMTPLSLAHTQTSRVEHESARNIERYIPASFREQSDMLDQVAGAYTSHSRSEHSKLNIRSEKGRVVLGLRESKDEEVIKSLGLRVGVMDGGKKGKRRWWRP